ACRCAVAPIGGADGPRPAAAPFARRLRLPGRRIVSRNAPGCRLDGGMRDRFSGGCAFHGSTAGAAYSERVFRCRRCGHGGGMARFRDKVSIFRADLITEGGYFGVLSYLVFVAAWRWLSDDPLSVMTDWLQVGVNLVAIMLLRLLWVRIKKMNEQLAKAIEE